MTPQSPCEAYLRETKTVYENLYTELLCSVSSNSQDVEITPNFHTDKLINKM